jgi:hypothetical protein
MLFQLQKLYSFIYDMKTITIRENMGKDFVGDDHSPFRRLHTLSSGNAEQNKEELK